MKSLATFLLFQAVAWGSVNVPVSDPVYGHIDKLIAAGLIEEYIYGQRPWARKEIARLLKEAEATRKEREVPPFIDEILASLRVDYAQEDLSQWFEGAAVSIDALNAQERRFPINAAGTVDSSLSPLTPYRDGREIASGANSYLDTRHSLEWEGLTLFGQPELRVTKPRATVWEADPSFRRLYAKYLIGGNFEIEVGRDELAWGQTENGGLTLSNNARPFEMLKLGSVHPFHLPWILKYVGPMRVTFFFGTHGAHYVFPWAFLTGWKFSFRPFSSFEWSVGTTTTIGGQGSPTGPPFHTYLVEAFLYGQTGEVNLSDHHFSGDWRWRLGFLGNAEFYGEAFWDDNGFDSVKATLTYRMGFTTGLYFPLLDTAGRWDLRFEVSKIPAIQYRHSIFTSGYTVDRRLLGNAWGSDSTSGRLVLGYHLSPKEKLTAGLEYASIHGDSYDKSADDSEFFKTTHLPEETRQILTAKLTRQLSSDFSAQYWIGLERVTNFDFKIGPDRWHYLLGASLAYSYPPDGK